MHATAAEALLLHKEGKRGAHDLVHRDTQGTSMPTTLLLLLADTTTTITYPPSSLRIQFMVQTHSR